MSQPITSVVKVATTAAQAKLFAALLQAEGIPAQVDGDSLADEVARVHVRREGLAAMPAHHQGAPCVNEQ